MMKESVNEVNLQGIVSELDIREIVKDGKNYVAGELVVKVQIEGEEKPSYIPVGFISADVKKDGGPNQNYARLQALKNFQSIASVGEAEATKVQIRGAKISESMFKPQNADSVVSAIKINSNFFTKVADNSYTPEASFAVTGYIVKMDEEIKLIDNVETVTGRLIVTLATIGYNDKVEIFNFIAEEQAHIDFIRANYNVEDTVRLGGKVRYTEEIVERTQEVGFGEAETKRFTRKTKEFIILRGSAGALTEEESYKPEDIKAGLAARKARQDEIAKKAESTANASAAPAQTGYSF